MSLVPARKRGFEELMRLVRVKPFEVTLAQAEVVGGVGVWWVGGGVSSLSE